MGTSHARAYHRMPEDFTIVGWKVVEIPASDRHLRSFTETIRVAREANTGLISSCWLT